MRLRPSGNTKSTATTRQNLGVTARLIQRWRQLRGAITQWFFIILLITLILVPLLLFSWLFFFTSMFNIQAITVIDAKDNTITAVKQIINEQVEGGPLGKNIFFVPTDSIEQAILDRLPQIKTIHVVRKLPATIKAIVQEKTPTILLLSGGKYHFVDEEGIAYERAMLDTLPGVALTVVKNDDQTTNVTLGTVAVQPTLISFLRQANEKIPTILDAEIGEVHIPSLAAKEVRVILSNNWIIYFDLTRGLVPQTEILSRLLADTITTEEQTALEYIDLRAPNRIYYKTKLDASSAQPSTTVN